MVAYHFRIASTFLTISLTKHIYLQALILTKNKIKEWPTAVLASLPKLLCLKLDGNPLRKVNIIYADPFLFIRSVIFPSVFRIGFLRLRCK